MLQLRVFGDSLEFFNNNLFHIGFDLVVVVFNFRLHGIVAVLL